MAEPPEFYLFVLSNLLLLAIGGVLTGLSAAAFRRSSNPAFRLSSVGFGLVTAGALAEAVYELGIRGTYELGGRELLALHSVEGVLIAGGLAALFYSLRNY